MPPEGCQAELIKFKTSQPSRQSLNTSDWPEILHGLLIYYSEPEKQRKKWFWTPFIFSIRPNIDKIIKRLQLSSDGCLHTTHHDFKSKNI